MKKFTVRTASALVAIMAIYTIYTIFSVNGLKILICLTTPLALSEFLQFLKPSYPSTANKLLFIFFGSLISLSAYFSVNYILPTFVLVLLLFLIYFLLKIKDSQNYKQTIETQSLTILGLIYCALFPSLIAQILSLPLGDKLFFLLITIVFSGDSFAYISGILFGKKKIFPIVSPNKTWVGSFGGLVASFIFSLILNKYLSLDFSLSKIALLSIITGIFGQLGDLFESLLKRTFNLKDSGKIMPGHGGILDRLDGLLFAGPVFYYIISL